MSTKTLFRSFAAGEITPELFGRIELTKFQTGLRLCKNFIVLPHGPVARRPGTKYVLEARDSTRPVRLIPFAFSADETVAIEFGHQYVRFHTQGGTILEASKTVLDITAGVVEITAHDYTDGDWVFMGGRYLIVDNATTDTFTTTDLAGNAVEPTGTTAARVYTLTSPYDAADLFDIHFAQNNDVLTLVHPGYAARELRRSGATNWAFATVSFAPTLAAPSGLAVTPTIAVSSNLSPQRYTVTSIGADGVTESLAAASVGTNNNLTLAGNFNTVSWSAVSGATRYNVYKQRGGAFGYIGQTTSLSIVDDNVLPDTSKVPPEDVIALNGSTGNYPSAVTYHEQRRFFAGTDNKPQTVFATRSGTESNLTSSFPSQADDALEFRLASLQQNRIRHLVPLGDLMALTAGGEWRIFSDNEPAITPTSLSVKPIGYSGASNVQMVVTSGSILYVQAQGSRVRELAYGARDEALVRSIDMAIMAPHLFNGFMVKELGYARAPDQMCWAIRNDGTLLGMTYLPEQQVYGWHQHTTDGTFESVCAIAENNEDATYLVVKRNVDGRDVRYIERLQSRLFTQQDEAYFVDSGLTYDGAPATTFTGLWHLEGKTVQILADGAVEPEQVVTDGQITLEEACSVVHIGLPYESDMQTLPLAFETAPAAGQGMFKNVQSVHLRVTQTSLFKAGPSFDRLTVNRSRAVSDDYDSPPSLKTQEERIAIQGNWGTDGSVCVRQDQPLPLTVLAMTLDVQTGG